MSFANYVDSIINVINTLVVPTILSLTFFVFVYGVLKQFVFEGDDTARKKGRQITLWGLIGMAIVFSLWGLVALLLSTLGLE